MKTTISIAAALSASTTTASAHVVFAEGQAQPGSYHAGFLRVGHGCEQSATVEVEVTIPEAILSARPQPLPGWTLKIAREPLATPASGEGATVRERVKTITWIGHLPPDQFQQFGVLMKLPAESGELYFPTVQRCESGAKTWTEIPSAPENWHTLRHPAPMLILTRPDEPAGGHQH